MIKTLVITTNGIEVFGGGEGRAAGVRGLTVVAGGAVVAVGRAGGRTRVAAVVRRDGVARAAAGAHAAEARTHILIGQKKKNAKKSRSDTWSG